MVWSVIQNFRNAIKYRGGVWGVLEHMYVVRIHLRDSDAVSFRLLM